MNNGTRNFKNSESMETYVPSYAQLFIGANIFQWIDTLSLYKNSNADRYLIIRKTQD